MNQSLPKTSHDLPQGRAVLSAGQSSQGSPGAAGAVAPVLLSNADVDRLRDAFLANDGVLQFDQVAALQLGSVYDLKEIGWLQNNPVRWKGGYVPGQLLAAILIERNAVNKPTILKHIRD